MLQTITTKFKVGDKVKCVGNSIGSNDTDPNYGGVGWKRDFVFIIKEISGNPSRIVYWPLDGNGGVFENFLSFDNDWDQ